MTYINTLSNICRFAAGVKTTPVNRFVNGFLLIPNFGRFSYSVEDNTIHIFVMIMIWSRMFLLGRIEH